MKRALYVTLLCMISNGISCTLQSFGNVFLVQETVSFSVNCTSNENISFVWKYGDGLEDNGTTPSTQHAFSSAGVYGVQVFVYYNNVFQLQDEVRIQVLNPTTSHKPIRNKKVMFDEGNNVWTVNEDNHSISVINENGILENEIKVGKAPSSIAQNQGTIWVVNSQSHNVTVLDVESKKVTNTISLPYGSNPQGIVIDTIHGWAYISLQDKGKVLKMSTNSHQIVKESNDIRFARAMALNAEKNKLYVSEYVTQGDEAKIHVLNTNDLSVINTIILPYDNSPSTGANGPGVLNAIGNVTISPDGKYLWYTAKKDNVKNGKFLSNTNLTHDRIVRTVVGQVDLETNQEVEKNGNPNRIDLDNSCLANSIEFVKNGSYMVVTTECSNGFFTINSLDGSFKVYVPNAHKEKELAPNDALMRDSTLFVHYFMSRTLGKYRYTGGIGLGTIEVQNFYPTVQQDSLSETLLLGKQVFYNGLDPRMSSEGYISCSVCHLDGRSDHRVYDMTQLGEGLRKTTSLKGKRGLGQGLLHYSANFDEMQDFEHAMRDFFGGTGFIIGDPPEALGKPKAGMSVELDALAEYVGSLKEDGKNPDRDGTMNFSISAERGKNLFNSASLKCNTCHSEPFYTSSKNFENKKYDVGTSNGLQLDVPTLYGLWRGGPYLHDGSAGSLKQVLVDKNPNDHHGQTSHLNQNQIQDLISFLKELEDTQIGPLVDSIKWNTLPKEMNVGEKYTLDPKVFPNEVSEEKVYYTLSDSSLADIKNEVLITKKEGELVLYGYVKDGSNVFIRKTIQIGEHTFVEDRLGFRETQYEVELFRLDGRFVTRFKVDHYQKSKVWEKMQWTQGTGAYIVRVFSNNVFVQSYKMKITK